MSLTDFICSVSARRVQYNLKYNNFTVLSKSKYTTTVRDNTWSHKLEEKWNMRKNLITTEGQINYCLFH